MTRSVRVALWLVALAVAATATAPETTWAKLESFVRARAQLAVRAVNSFTTWVFKNDRLNNHDGKDPELEVGSVKMEVDGFDGVGEADDDDNDDDSTRLVKAKAEYEAAKEAVSQATANLGAQMRQPKNSPPSTT